MWMNCQAHNTEDPCLCSGLCIVSFSVSFKGVGSCEGKGLDILAAMPPVATGQNLEVTLSKVELRLV